MVAKRKSKAPPPEHPRAERVHQYARDVVDGTIVAGRFVVAACRRHLKDLETAAKRGLVWRAEKAESALSFIEEVVNLKPGTPFVLQGFQAFIVGSVFGWYRVDGRRRFRTLYAEMGKGNGKTPLVAAIGLYGLVVDTEFRPEIYSAAAAKDQALICFNDAVQMVKASPELASRVVVLTKTLTSEARHGVFRPLSSEDKSHHGLRVHMGLLDEIHAHGSSAMVDTIEAGTKNCRNALIALITNSGSDRRGTCFAYHTRSKQMLRGKPDENLFAYVCTLDPCPKCQRAGKEQPDPKCKACDQFDDERVWLKANPGLDTILDRDYLAQRVALAKRMPSKRNNVLQLNFCLWTESDNGWLDMYAWRNHCLDKTLKLEQFAGQRCWLGLDAANRIDATALAVVFERSPGAGTLDASKLNEAAREALREAVGAAGEGRVNESEPDALPETPAVQTLNAAGYVVFGRVYVPEAMVNNQSQANFEAYQTWKDEGHIIVTPGAITDFARIEEDIRYFDQTFQVQRLQADPRELGYLLQRVAGWAGFEVVEVSQGATMISQPMKFFEGLVAAALMKHDGNPVLDWMLGNIVQKTTRTGGPVKYYYPTKPSEAQKIDLGPAAFMALDGALRGGQPTASPGMAMLG